MEWVEDRKAFAAGFVAEVRASILAAAEEKAERQRSAGRWDDLKQLRLDGLRDVLAEVEDFSLPGLSDILWRHGLRADFQLLERGTDDVVAACLQPAHPASTSPPSGPAGTTTPESACGTARI